MGNLSAKQSKTVPTSQEPLDSIVRIYAEKLLEMAGSEPFSVEKIVEFNLQAMPDTTSSEPLPQSISAQITQALSGYGLDGKLKILYDK